MITLHLLENSRALRIAWLLEELELDYEIVTYRRDRSSSAAPEALRRIHPLGKSPVVTDGDITIAESGAIVHHLCTAYGEGLLVPPPSTPGHLQYHYWLHAAEGTFMPVILVDFLASKIRAGVPFFVRPVARAIVGQLRKQYVLPNVSRLVALVESHLAEHKWFAGDDLSGADIQMSFPLQAIAGRIAGAGPHPAIDAYLGRIEQRPAYLRALERAGGFELLKG